MPSDPVSGCNNAFVRESLRQLLEDAHPWPTWGAIDEAVNHWKECGSCQSDFPESRSRLISLRRDLEKEVRDRISFLRKSYLAAKYSAEANDNEDTQCEILAHLAATGDRLEEILWSTNTSEVPFMGFSPILAVNVGSDDSELSDILAGAMEFFKTLSQEEQEFVAAATGAVELFDRSLTGNGTDATPEDEDPDARRLRMYQHVMTDSSLSPAIVRTALELGAESIVKEYLQKVATITSRRPSPVSPSAHKEPLAHSGLDEFRRDLLGQLDDFSDSMKATQMELVRLLEERHERLDPDPYLVEALGIELWSKLSDATKRLLRTSELDYRSPRTGLDEHVSTMLLVQAYETEFLDRIKTPLLKRLLEERQTDFPPQSKIKLTENGRPNNRVTSLQVLHLVGDHPRLQELLRARGFDPIQLLATGRPVMELRNRVVHQDYRPGDIETARARILVRSGGPFQALIPALL
jgi:hypothetical protein